MVKQYPHILKTTVITGSTQDGNGNWTGGTPTEVQTPCRFEPNEKSGFIKADDGSQIVYDGIVYLPLPATEIAPGTQVEVLNGATVLSNGSVKRFSSAQLNARVWL